MTNEATELVKIAIEGALQYSRYPIETPSPRSDAIGNLSLR
jgi:hypothetical protein